jgi:hypothetical protein
MQLDIVLLTQVPASYKYLLQNDDNCTCSPEGSRGDGSTQRKFNDLRALFELTLDRFDTVKQSAFVRTRYSAHSRLSKTSAAAM